MIGDYDRWMEEVVCTSPDMKIRSFDNQYLPVITEFIYTKNIVNIEGI